MQRYALAPDVVTYTGAIKVRVKGLQHKQNLHLFRALQHHAIVMVVVTCTAAICA